MNIKRVPNPSQFPGKQSHISSGRLQVSIATTKSISASTVSWKKAIRTVAKLHSTLLIGWISRHFTRGRCCILESRHMAAISSRLSSNERNHYLRKGIDNSVLTRPAPNHMASSLSKERPRRWLGRWEHPLSAPLRTPEPSLPPMSLKDLTQPSNFS